MNIYSFKSSRYARETDFIFLAHMLYRFKQNKSSKVLHSTIFEGLAFTQNKIFLKNTNLDAKGVKRTVLKLASRFHKFFPKIFCFTWMPGYQKFDHYIRSLEILFWLDLYVVYVKSKIFTCASCIATSCLACALASYCWECLCLLLLTARFEQQKNRPRLLTETRGLSGSLCDIWQGEPTTSEVHVVLTPLLSKMVVELECLLQDGAADAFLFWRSGLFDLALGPGW